MESATAKKALGTIWLAMIELAEASNDHVVALQRRQSVRDTRKIASFAEDLSTLARSAVVLARHVARAP